MFNPTVTGTEAGLLGVEEDKGGREWSVVMPQKGKSEWEFTPVNVRVAVTHATHTPMSCIPVCHICVCRAGSLVLCCYLSPLVGVLSSP